MTIPTQRQFSVRIVTIPNQQQFPVTIVIISSQDGDFFPQSNSSQLVTIPIRSYDYANHNSDNSQLMTFPVIIMISFKQRWHAKSQLQEGHLSEGCRGMFWTLCHETKILLYKLAPLYLIHIIKKIGLLVRNLTLFSEFEKK